MPRGAPSPIARMRARAMGGVYATGLLVAAVMAGHDVMFAPPDHLGLHLLTEGLLAASMLVFLGFLARGRDEIAANGVLVLLLVLEVMSLTDAFSDHPEGFYTGFARWAPVFIVVSMLFATPTVAGLVTAISVGWTGLYYVLFCRDLPEPIRLSALEEVWEVSAVNTIVGVVGVLSMVLVRSSMRQAEALNEELEQRVLERTAALDAALSQRQAVLESLTDGLVVVGADGRTLEIANAAAQALLPGPELPDDLRAWLDAAWRTTERVHGEVALTGDRVGQVVARRFDAEDGRPLGVAALIRDVTREREIDRMKTDFISLASHELRTPLTSVLGFAKIIRSKLERRVFGHVPADDPKARKAVETVRADVDVVIREGERLTALINDILDISKMEAGRIEYRREPVDLGAIGRHAADAVSSLFVPGGPALVVDVAPDLPAVPGDEHRLVQVLVNLLSNAHKFTGRGSVTLTIAPRDGGVEVAVTDTGRGIAPHDLDTVFERFRQVGDPLTDKPRGTGLGLPICQGIVRAHGSQLSVESQVGVGSRFWFVLRAADLSSGRLGAD